MTQPIVFAFTGKPGVGKTTAITELDSLREITVHQTDTIRKELSDTPKYTSEESKKTYKTLFNKVKQSLRKNKNTVIDATMNLQKGRDKIEKIAEETNSSVVFVHVTCDEETTKTRLKNRSESTAISDATVETYENFYFEQFDRPRIVIDNSTTLTDLKEEITDTLLPLMDDTESKYKLPN
jgi:predicted kinase